jgi:hypothetical protein
MATKKKKEIGVAPTVTGAKRKRNGRTSKNGGHSHSYSLDKNGNGETSRDNKHVHSVRAFSVKPSGKASHSHQLQ